MDEIIMGYTPEQQKIIEAKLPKYLKKDIDALVEGEKNNSHLLDCLYDEVQGSINIAQINDNVITEREADFLRRKYLGW